MRWKETIMKQLLLEVAHEQAAWFEEHLAMFDITGLEIENDQDPVYTQSNWYRDEAYVPPKQAAAYIKIYADDDVLEDIRQSVQDEVISSYYIDVVDENWNAKWIASFRGFPIGESLYVQPVHDEPHPSRINLMIQAGMAFGTGTHETTLGCLEALERYLQPGDEVIDVGSGSGILSIAAAKLGARHVTAVEIDQAALGNAAENRLLNQVEDQITQLSGDLVSTLNEDCQLMVANILPEVLVRLAPDAKRLIRPGGILILSGILNERVEALTNHYQEGFRLIETITRGDWNTLIFRRYDA